MAHEYDYDEDDLNPVEILRDFDRIFDAFNEKKISKTDLIRNCKEIRKRLLVSNKK